MRPITNRGQGSRSRRGGCGVEWGGDACVAQCRRAIINRVGTLASPSPLPTIVMYAPLPYVAIGQQWSLYPRLGRHLVPEK
jgi:hypothetical protein